MARTDLIADGLTMIRNAIMANKESLDIPSSRILMEIMKILKDQEYIENFKPIEDNKQDLIRIYLKYRRGKSAITNIQRVSRPGLRSYVKCAKVPSVLRGLGLAILTTPKGLMTDIQARHNGIGGEVIAYVW